MSIWKREKPSTQVLITPEAYMKQCGLVASCDAEIGWFGLVEEVEIDEGFTIPRVYEIIVPDQVVSVGSVEAGEEMNDEELGEKFSLADFLAEHADVAHLMRFSGHSHVHGFCSPSWIDLNQINDWDDYGMPYMISHIQNKFRETYTRLDQFTPRKVTSPVDLVVETEESISRWAHLEIRDRVTEKKWNYETKRYELVA